MTENTILIIKENPYYTRKKPLNKNQKILKALGISLKDFASFIGRSYVYVQRDFGNPENMQKSSQKRSVKRGIFYARKLAEMTGRNIDENIFL